MQVGQYVTDTVDYISRDQLTELALIGDPIEKLAPTDVVHDQRHGFCVSKDIVQVDNVWVLQLTETK